MIFLKLCLYICAGCMAAGFAVLLAMLIVFVYEGYREWRRDKK